jgi:heptosyltransferase-2
VAGQGTEVSESPKAELASEAAETPETPETPETTETADARASGERKSARPVLLARGLNWLGDAVLSLPALLASKLACQGDLTVVARGAGAALYRLLPSAWEVLDDNRGLKARYRLIKELRRRNYPRALLFQNAFGAALTAFLAGVPSRAGYSRHGRRPLLTLPVDPRPEDLAAHEVFYHLRLVSEAGMPAPFSLPRISGFSGIRRISGAQLFPQGSEGGQDPEEKRGFLLALAPGASYGSAKRWPAKSFATAARLILEGRPGKAVILGGTSELEACAETESLLQGGPGA